MLKTVVWVVACVLLSLQVSYAQGEETPFFDTNVRQYNGNTLALYLQVNEPSCCPCPLPRMNALIQFRERDISTYSGGRVLICLASTMLLSAVCGGMYWFINQSVQTHP